jgi:uncharacterized protein YkwD
VAFVPEQGSGEIVRYSRRMTYRRIWQPIAVLGIIALVLSGCSNPTAATNAVPEELPAEAAEFVSLMNEHRVDQGLAPLEWNTALGNVALAHSQDMRDRDFFDHTNPDGDSPFDRMAAAGISYRRAGENIAYGYRTGEAVFTGWINSDGHRANIENA